MFPVGEAQDSFLKAANAGKDAGGFQELFFDKGFERQQKVITGMKAQSLCIHRLCALQRYQFTGTALGFNDIRHTAHNSHLHFVRQVVVIQAGVAKNQVHTFGFERL